MYMYFVGENPYQRCKIFYQYLNFTDSKHWNLISFKIEENTNLK
jgi:hypothetical protein